MEAQDSGRELLNSWKEIAQYLGRGTRTVQRWERELAMPVRRPRAKRRSAVIAFRGELDVWIMTSPALQSHENDGRIYDSRIVAVNDKPLQEAIALSRGLRSKNRELTRSLSLASLALVASLKRIQGPP